MSSNSRAMIAIVVVVIMVAFAWQKLSQNETPSSTTDFSSWSPKSDERPASAGTPPILSRQAASSRPRPAPQGDARRNMDPAMALSDRARGAMGPIFQPSPRALETYKKLPRGKVREINGQNYHVLGAWGVPRDSYSASMGEILQMQGNYAIVTLDDSAGDSWKNLSVRPDTRPVLEGDGGRLTIVTGTLEVKLKDLEKAGAIADAEHLQVLGVDESIKMVYYKAPPGYSLLDGVDRLKARPEVERVELELDQSRKVGR